MQYEPTPTAPLYLIVAATRIGMFVAAWMVPAQGVRVILVVSGLLMLLLALSFRHLKITDDGDQLLIGFGPLPLFRKRVFYSAIERVEQARSTILDGWGIHLSPSGGWVWNLWGFDCVDVWYEKGAKTKKFRIGTDDPVGLSAHLKERAKKERA